MKKTKNRSILDLENEVAESVKHTIHILETKYGAEYFVDTGHAISPTRIYRALDYGVVMVGIRMNKHALTLYIGDRTCDGKYLRDILTTNKVAKVYPDDGKPAGSILRYLKPSAENKVLRLELEREDIESVLAGFFGEQPATTSAPEIASDRNKPATSVEKFLVSLEHKSETGHLGECCAFDDERERLKSRGCPKPEDYVFHVSLVDVGRGYDIESTWPGEERCIEVKTTTCAGSDFYLTSNERSVLTRLGERAWLYRVLVDAGGQGKIEECLQNPMKFIKEEQLTPIVWSIPAIALTTRSCY